MKRRTQESWAASQARVQRIWDGLPPEEGTKMQRLKENEQHEWPDPKPLPHGLAEVEPYSSEFLPAKLAKWVDDIANRLQCPPDYVAVAAIVALGSVPASGLRRIWTRGRSRPRTRQRTAQRLLPVIVNPVWCAEGLGAVIRDTCAPRTDSPWRTETPG